MARLRQVEDANQNTTTFEYDDFYRPTATILPMGQRNQTVYDQFGQVSSETDFNGDTINYTIMNKHNELTEKLNKMLIESANQESIIKFLRLSNYSKTESIEIFRKALGISYYEAQTIIHNSQTWSDVKEIDAKINNDFFDVLEESGSPESEET